MRRHRAGTELSVYPSDEYSRTLRGRVRLGVRGTKEDDGVVDARDRKL